MASDSWKVRVGSAELPFLPTHLSVYTKLFNREIAGLRGTSVNLPTGRNMTFIDLRFLLTGSKVTVVQSDRARGTVESTDIAEFALMISQFRSSFFLPLSTIEESGLNLLSLLIDDVSSSDSSEILDTKAAELAKAIESHATIDKMVNQLVDVVTKQVNNLTPKVSNAPSAQTIRTAVSGVIDLWLRDSSASKANVETLRVRISDRIHATLANLTFEQSEVSKLIAQATSGVADAVDAVSNFLSGRIEQDIPALGLQISRSTDTNSAISSVILALDDIEKSKTKLADVLSVQKQLADKPQSLYNPIQVSLQSIEWATHDTIKPGIVAKVSLVLFNHESYLSDVEYYQSEKNITQANVNHPLNKTSDITASDVFLEYSKHWKTTTEANKHWSEKSFNTRRSGKCVIPTISDITLGQTSTTIIHDLFNYEVVSLNNKYKEIAKELNTPSSMDPTTSSFIPGGALTQRASTVDATAAIGTLHDDEKLAILKEAIFRGAKFGFELARTINPTPSQISPADRTLDSYITGIKCRLQHDFGVLPIQGPNHPTLQFYGRPHGSVAIDMIFDATDDTDMNLLGALKRLVKKSNDFYNTANFNRFMRLYPILLDNYVINMGGMHFFSFEDISVQSIETTAGSVSVTLTLTEQIIPPLEEKTGLSSTSVPSSRVTESIATTSSMLSAIFDFITSDKLNTSDGMAMKMNVFAKVMSEVLTSEVWYRWYLDYVMPVMTRCDRIDAAASNSLFYKSQYNDRDLSAFVKTAAAGIDPDSKPITTSKQKSTGVSIESLLDDALWRASLAIEIVGYYKFIATMESNGFTRIGDRFTKDNENLPHSFSELLARRRTGIPNTGVYAEISANPDPFNMYQDMGFWAGSLDAAKRLIDIITFDVLNANLFIVPNRPNTSPNETIWNSNAVKEFGERDVNINILANPRPIPEDFIGQRINSPGYSASATLVEQEWRTKLIAHELYRIGHLSKEEVDNYCAEVKDICDNLAEASGMGALNASLHFIVSGVHAVGRSIEWGVLKALPSTAAADAFAVEGFNKVLALSRGFENSNILNVWFQVFEKTPDAFYTAARELGVVRGQAAHVTTRLGSVASGSKTLWRGAMVALSPLATTLLDVVAYAGATGWAVLKRLVFSGGGIIEDAAILAGQSVLAGEQAAIVAQRRGVSTTNAFITTSAGSMFRLTRESAQVARAGTSVVRTGAKAVGAVLATADTLLIPDQVARTRTLCVTAIGNWFRNKLATQLLTNNLPTEVQCNNLERVIEKNPAALQALTEVYSTIVTFGYTTSSKTKKTIVSAYPDMDLPTYRQLFDVAQYDIDILVEDIYSVASSIDDMTPDGIRARARLVEVGTKLRDGTTDELVDNASVAITELRNVIASIGVMLLANGSDPAKFSYIGKYQEALEKIKNIVNRLGNMNNAVAVALMPTYQSRGIEPPYDGTENPGARKCRTMDHYVDPCCYIVSATRTPLEDFQDSPIPMSSDTSVIQGVSDKPPDASHQIKPSDKYRLLTDGKKASLFSGNGNRSSLRNIMKSGTGPAGYSDPGVFIRKVIDKFKTDDELNRLAPMTVEQSSIRTSQMYTDTLNGAVFMKAANSRFTGIEHNSIHKAFPTFLVYFIREHKDKYDRVIISDIFSYQHVVDFSVNKDKLRGAVATMTLANHYGVLDNDRFSTLKEAPDIDPNIRAQDLESRFNMSEIMLAPGTSVQIKQGYGSNPDELENVFCGKISEISKDGELITLVMQGHEHELMNNLDVDFDVGFFTGRNYYDWATKAMQYTSHFGNRFFLDDLKALSNLKEVKSKELYTGGTLNMYVAGWLSSQMNASRTSENIWVGNNSTAFIDWFMTDDFKSHGKTMLECLHEISRYLPDTVVSPLPMDHRSTLFMGPVGQFYKYTEAFDAPARALVSENLSVHYSLQSIEGNKPSTAVKDFIRKVNPHNWYPLTEVLTGQANYGHCRYLPLVNVLIEYTPTKDGELRSFYEIEDKNILGRVYTKKDTRGLYATDYNVGGILYQDPISRILDMDISKELGSITVTDLVELLRYFMWCFYVETNIKVSTTTDTWSNTTVISFREDIPQYMINSAGGRPELKDITAKRLVAEKHIAAKADLRTLMVDSDGTLLRIATALKSSNAYGLLDPLLSQLIDTIEWDAKHWLATLKVFILSAAVSIGGKATPEYKSSAAQESKSLSKKTAPKLFPGYKPFRQYWAIDDNDIIRNEIECSTAEMANEIRLSYPTGLKNEGSLWDEVLKYTEILGPDSNNYYTSRTVSFDPFQHSSHKLIRNIREPNAFYTKDSINIGYRDLAEAMKPMYRGQLIIMGKKDIKPYDIVFIRDSYNAMFGCIEVAEVTHSHTIKEGWVTTIVPHLVTQNQYVESATKILIMDALFATTKATLDLAMLGTVFTGGGAVLRSVGALAGKGVGSALGAAGISTTNAAITSASGQAWGVLAKNVGLAGWSILGKYMAYKLITDFGLKSLHKLSYSDAVMAQIINPQYMISPRTVLTSEDAVNTSAMKASSELELSTGLKFASHLSPVSIFPLSKNGHPWTAGLQGTDLGHCLKFSSLTREFTRMYWDDMARGADYLKEDLSTTLTQAEFWIKRHMDALGGSL